MSELSRSTGRSGEGTAGPRAQRIEGERVVLREKRLSDAELDYAWRCDPDLARLDAAEPLKTPFSTFLRRYQEDLRFPYLHWHRLAIETFDGKHIGNCVYHNGSGEPNEAELGIMIGDPQYRDKGYGTDVISTVVRHMFQDPGFDRIYLHTLDWNIRAQKCFSKCGFVTCGELVRGEYTFMVMELRRAWKRGRVEGSSPTAGQEKAGCPPRS